MALRAYMEKKNLIPPSFEKNNNNKDQQQPQLFKSKFSPESKKNITIKGKLDKSSIAQGLADIPGYYKDQLKNFTFKSSSSSSVSDNSTKKDKYDKDSRFNWDTSFDNHKPSNLMKDHSNRRGTRSHFQTKDIDYHHPGYGRRKIESREPAAFFNDKNSQFNYDFDDKFQQETEENLERMFKSQHFQPRESYLIKRTPNVKIFENQERINEYLNSKEYQRPSIAKFHRGSTLPLRPDGAYPDPKGEYPTDFNPAVYNNPPKPTFKSTFNSNIEALDTRRFRLDAYEERDANDPLFYPKPQFLQENRNIYIEEQPIEMEGIDNGEMWQAGKNHGGFLGHRTTNMIPSDLAELDTLNKSEVTFNSNVSRYRSNVFYDESRFMDHPIDEEYNVKLDFPDTEYITKEEIGNISRYRNNLFYDQSRFMTQFDNEQQNAKMNFPDTDLTKEEISRMSRRGMRLRNNRNNILPNNYNPATINIDYDNELEDSLHHYIRRANKPLTVFNPPDQMINQAQKLEYMESKGQERGIMKKSNKIPVVPSEDSYRQIEDVNIPSLNDKLLIPIMGSPIRDREIYDKNQKQELNTNIDEAPNLRPSLQKRVRFLDEQDSMFHELPYQYLSDENMIMPSFDRSIRKRTRTINVDKFLNEIFSNDNDKQQRNIMGIEQKERLKAGNLPAIDYDSEKIMGTPIHHKINEKDRPYSLSEGKAAIIPKKDPLGLSHHFKFKINENNENDNGNVGNAVLPNVPEIHTRETDAALGPKQIREHHKEQQQHKHKENIKTNEKSTAKENFRYFTLPLHHHHHQHHHQHHLKHQQLHHRRPLSMEGSKKNIDEANFIIKNMKEELPV